MGLIYKAENLINSKVYIGFTLKTLDYRRKLHEQLARKGAGYYFHYALNKYGFENFEWSVLEDNLDEDACLVQESYWISKHQSNKSEYGYNLTSGGDHTTLNPEVCKKISEAKLGEKHPFYGKHHSEEMRRKISESSKGKHKERLATYARNPKRLATISKRFTGEGNPFYGKKHTEEFKKSRCGAGNPMFGKHLSEETKAKLSAKLKGRKREKSYKLSEEHKAKISAGLKARDMTWTESRRLKCSSGYVCPYCGREFGKSHYTRYHGERCKLNPNRDLSHYVECEWCHKKMPPHSYRQYHGDKCKLNPNRKEYYHE